MKNTVQLINAIPSLRPSPNQSPWRRGLLLIPLALTAACLALSPQARADCHQECLINGGTAFGEDALTSNSGAYNTAVGFNALFNNNTGVFNTATGYQALFSNTTGSFNTAYGSQALWLNTTGSYNTASGWLALNRNITGFNNTASGYYALWSNTAGHNNTAN